MVMQGYDISSWFKWGCVGLQSLADINNLICLFPQSGLRTSSSFPRDEFPKMADDTRENGPSAADTPAAPPKKLPKGMIMGKDGKPYASIYKHILHLD
jgi:hypothetical protein